MTAVKFKTWKKNRVLLITLCAVVAAGVIAALIYAHWYFSPAQRLLRALDAQELTQLRQLYSQVEKVPEEFRTGICEKLEELSARYVSGELDYAQADRALVVYEEVEAEGTEEALKSCRQILEKIRLSREAYVKGQRLEASKDYPAAMDSYGQVIEEDLWGWENAQQKIQACRNAFRDLILRQAADLAETEAYADAMDKLREGLEVLEEDESLLAQLDAYILDEQDKQRRDLLAQVDSLCKAGDYPAAIGLLEGREDPVLQEAWTSRCGEYASVSLSAAEEAFKLEGYEEALSIIENCLLTLSNNEDLLEAKAWYESYRPEYLSLFALSVSEGSKLYLDQHTRDWKENTYGHSLAVNKGSITVQTGGEFALLTGTLACPFGYAPDDYREGASVEILADGEVIYQSPMMAEDSQPRYFELDISGVQQITITWQCEGRNIWKNWGDRATIFDGALYRHGDRNA